MRRLVIPAIAFACLATAVTAQDQRADGRAASKTGNSQVEVDEVPTLERLPRILARRIAAREEKIRKYGLVDPETKKDEKDKGVFNMTALWGSNHEKLNVCFLTASGSQQDRAKIAAIASEWTQFVPGLMPLNFGNPSNPQICAAGTQFQIRISSINHGDWSLVGSQSIVEAGQTEPSMNFTPKTFARAANDPILRQTVLHEFGHAYGLEHEHQHPFKTCEAEFNWPVIYKKVAAPPNKWTKDETDFQLRAVSKQGMLVKTFDKASVMLYALPADYFKSGQGSVCFNARNADLSNGDKKLLAEAYPPDRNKRIEVAQRNRDNHQKTLARANIQPNDIKHKDAFDFLNTIVPQE